MVGYYTLISLMTLFFGFVYSIFAEYVIFHLILYEIQSNPSTLIDHTYTINSQQDAVIKEMLTQQQIYHPRKYYLFKLNNRNTKRICEIGSKQIIKTPALVSSSVLLLTTPPIVFIVYSELIFVCQVSIVTKL